MTVRAGTIAKFLPLIVILAGSVFIESAWAGDGTGFTRHTWDLMMRWINFFILATVLVKYGRKPLLNFLDGQKKNITRSIDDLEEQKKQAEALVQQSQQQLAESQERLERIKELIISEGRLRKEQMISEAQNDARILVETTQSKIEGQMKTAFADLKAELIDMAANLALEKLPHLVTDEDRHQMLENWLSTSQA